jgi:hypothetical protein
LGNEKQTQKLRVHRRTFALAVPHAGARALADCLRAVDGKCAVAGGDDFGFSHFFTLADDIVAGSTGLRDCQYNCSSAQQECSDSKMWFLKISTLLTR